MDSSKSTSYNAGQVQGQAAEKKDQIIDSAGNAAQSVRDSVSQTGQAIADNAHSAADSVKNATGMNK